MRKIGKKVDDIEDTLRNKSLERKASVHQSRLFTRWRQTAVLGIHPAAEREKRSIKETGILESETQCSSLWSPARRSSQAVCSCRLPKKGETTGAVHMALKNAVQNAHVFLHINQVKGLQKASLLLSAHNCFVQVHLYFKKELNSARSFFIKEFFHSTVTLTIAAQNLMISFVVDSVEFTLLHSKNGKKIFLSVKSFL